LAPLRPNVLHPLASAVTGLSAGAVLTLLWPTPLGASLGLLLAGGGGLGSMWLADRRAQAQREQVLAAVGEVKVRLATNAIRLDALSKRVEQMPMRDADAAPARAAINELTAEVGLLGDLIHQVATTLADHDAALAAVQARANAVPAPEARAPAVAAAAKAGLQPAPSSAPLVVVDPEAARQERLKAQAAERAEAARQAEERAAAERAAVIGAALSEGRVEVHLQPIVQLPQRRTRGYEALVRLRLDEHTLLLPHEFIPVIEERGFGPTLDALVLTRALAIARHLGSKPGELFVSCNFSGATWTSSKALATLSRILEKYREHTGHLIIEMPQRVFRGLDPTSLGLLGAMSANGVRFALDELVDLRVDPVALFDRGIRFVKAPAALLMEQIDSDTTDIAPADLSALLARASIVLVADQVADDPTVADMIDLGVGMGQGPVFSPPRPVKPDVFAEPAEPAPAAAVAEPTPPPQPAPEQRLAEVVDYPAQPAAAREAPPERQSFRSVLRRATA